MKKKNNEKRKEKLREKNVKIEKAKEKEKREEGREEEMVSEQPESCFIEVPNKGLEFRQKHGGEMKDRRLGIRVREK